MEEINLAVKEKSLLRQELDRKTFETFEWLLHSVENGNLTKDQFSVGVDTLFMAVSGLVDKKFIGLVTETRHLCDAESRSSVKRIFHAPNKDSLIIFSWRAGQSRVIVVHYECGEAIQSKAQLFDDAKQARDYFENIGKKMQKSEYVEIF